MVEVCNKNGRRNLRGFPIYLIQRPDIKHKDNNCEGADFFYN